MNRGTMIGGVGLALLSGCTQPAPAPALAPAPSEVGRSPSEVGRYQVVSTAKGSLRVDSVTGRTYLMVVGKTPPAGTYATWDGQPLVWYEVKEAAD
jgi:hypothetical protein